MYLDNLSIHFHLSHKISGVYLRNCSYFVSFAGMKLYLDYNPDHNILRHFDVW